MSDDVLFNIFYGGKFENLGDDCLVYKGGCRQDLVTPVRSFFEGLPVSLYGQRLWYKLPFEDLKDLKILCEGIENFDKMCEASKWTTMIEIYMEADEDHNDKRGGEQNEQIGAEQNKQRGAEQNELRGAKQNELRGSKQNEDRGGDGNHGREEYQMSWEEARVEELVAGFVDEEENDDYLKTPPTSDGEGGEIQSCPYDRYIRDSGELNVLQVFESIKEFRETVLEYALKGGWNVKFDRWGSVKSGAVCGVEKCKWKVYAYYERSISMWMIKTLQEVHTCYPDGRCRMILKTFTVSDPNGQA